MQRLTLAQQIAQLEDTTHTDFDPEDIHGGSGKNNAGADNDGNVDMVNGDPDAGREHYLDVGPSELRKMRDSIADPKYDGVKTSRNQLLAHESDEEEDNGPSDDDQEELTPRIHDEPSSASEVEEDGEDQVVHTSQRVTRKSRARRGHSPPSQEDGVKASPHEDEALASSLRRTRAADKLKGKAVSRQLAIWDSLVDARIRLQKSVTAANKLPHPDNMGPYVSSSAGHAGAQTFLSEALQLSEELFELRHTLVAQKGEKGVALPPRKRRRIEAGADELDYESLVGESTLEMVTLDAETHPDTLSTLQKWSAKVQAVAPAALLSSSRVSFKGPAHVKSAGELVEEALREQGKAVKRTWGKVDKGARIGGSKLTGVEDEDDEEAFDDREFYQAVLRDVIESKGGKDGISAADLYANSKKQKKKKVVDTKASKGRKLRYEPHEKLQNFMVPVPVRGAWHEEQIDELFASLLGKGFEGDGMGGQEIGAAAGPARVEKESEALHAFRVFG